MRIYTYTGIDLTNVYYFTDPIDLSTFRGTGVSKYSISLKREGEAAVATVVFTPQFSGDGFNWINQGSSAITGEDSTNGVGYTVPAAVYMRAKITTAGTGRGTLTIMLEDPPIAF